MDEDDGQQYDHSEQQRFETEQGHLLVLIFREASQQRRLQRIEDEMMGLAVEHNALRLAHQCTVKDLAALRKTVSP